MTERRVPNLLSINALPDPTVLTPQERYTQCTHTHTHTHTITDTPSQAVQTVCALCYVGLCREAVYTYTHTHTHTAFSWREETQRENHQKQTIPPDTQHEKSMRQREQDWQD